MVCPAYTSHLGGWARNLGAQDALSMSDADLEQHLLDRNVPCDFFAVFPSYVDRALKLLEDGPDTQ